MFRTLSRPEAKMVALSATDPRAVNQGWDEAQSARARALLSNLFEDDDLAQLAQLRT